MLGGNDGRRHNGIVAFQDTISVPKALIEIAGAIEGHTAESIGFSESVFRDAPPVRMHISAIVDEQFADSIGKRRSVARRTTLEIIECVF